MIGNFQSNPIVLAKPTRKQPPPVTTFNSFGNQKSSERFEELKAKIILKNPSEIVKERSSKFNSLTDIGGRIDSVNPGLSSCLRQSAEILAGEANHFGIINNGQLYILNNISDRRGRKSLSRDNTYRSSLSQGETEQATNTGANTDVRDNLTPQITKIRFPLKVRMVSCENEVTGTVMENGEAYFWGQNDYLLPDCPAIINEPTSILLSRPALKIKVRSTGLALILEDGSIYYRTKKSAIEVPLKAIDLSISMVANELGVITEDYQLYKLQSDGKLIQVNLSDFSVGEKSIHNRTVQQISLGLGCIAVLSGRGEVYLWGRNDYGQLGFGHFDRLSRPTRLSLPLDPSDTIKRITCHGFFGGSHPTTTIITQQGSLYMWGSNICNKISTENGLIRLFKIYRSLDKIADPLEIKIASSEKIKSDDRIKSVAVGYKSTLAVTADDQIHFWGY